MMKQYSMNKMLHLVLCVVLIAAMALSFTGCGSSSTPETTQASTVSFTVTVADLDGNETVFDITTDKATVGEALIEEGLIDGEEGPYGLYILTVNGITADWDKDQTYWAFYINGDYATTGIELTEITPDTDYALVLTKG